MDEWLLYELRSKVNQLEERIEKLEYECKQLDNTTNQSTAESQCRNLIDNLTQTVRKIENSGFQIRAIRSYQEKMLQVVNGNTSQRVLQSIADAKKETEREIANRREEIRRCSGLIDEYNYRIAMLLKEESEG